MVEFGRQSLGIRMAGQKAYLYTSDVDPCPTSTKTQPILSIVIYFGVSDEWCFYSDTHKLTAVNCGRTGLGGMVRLTRSHVLKFVSGDPHLPGTVNLLLTAGAWRVTAVVACLEKYADGIAGTEKRPWMESEEIQKGRGPLLARSHDGIVFVHQLLATKPPCEHSFQSTHAYNRYIPSPPPFSSFTTKKKRVLQAQGNQPPPPKDTV